MKKLLALILALVMVMSLCACGSKDAADGTKPSQSPTTDTPTESKNDATQPSGENNATQPSEGNETTPAPTTPAPTTPAPTTQTTPSSTSPTIPSVPTVPTIPTTAPTVPTEPAADKAPDFTVYNINKETVKLSDYIGKPVILNFWASWCGPCTAEMPDFQEIYETYGDQIQFLMVNMTDGTYETRLSAQTFIESKGYTFPIFFDPYYSAVYAYDVQSIPATFFIDADGRIVSQISGRANAYQLQHGIDLLLSDPAQ